jgi:aspartyl/asparaginyl beta-hydroxylase (cupin superfamily)
MQHNNTNKLWYGVYGKEYIGTEPAFFEVAQFDWAKTLTDNYNTILKELTPLMHEDNIELKPYFDDDIQFPPKNWKTIGFYFWGKQNSKTCKRFPKTNAVLKQIPGLISASFNMLEPHSYIKPHFGDTNAVYRVHLGIKIPEGLPNCGFTVKGETREWKEGELFVFLDANVHEAFNHTSYRRYILLLDIIRPEFAKKKYNVCSHVLAMLSVYYVMSLSPFLTRILKTFTSFWIKAILFPFRFIWRVYFFIYRF